VTVKTTDRVLGVLALFSGDRSVWTVDAAAGALEIPLTTAYRYFRSLTDAGLIHAYLPGRYVLGPAIIHFDRQLRLHDPLITVARSQMERLAADFGNGCVVLLARHYNDKVMCMDQHFAGRPQFPVSYERGRLMPIDRGAASKVILANLSPRHMRSLKAANRADAATGVLMTTELKAELRRIRASGFCIAEGEVNAGVRGIAVPLFQPDHSIDGSLSVATPISRDDTSLLIERLNHARQAIEAGLASLADRSATETFGLQFGRDDPRG
jgi:DNA-binding IclR family transcriptional regulator